MSDPKDKSFATTSSSGDSDIPEGKAVSGGSRGKPSKTGTTSKGQRPPIPTSTTRPEVLVRHDISEEELAMLLSTNKDGLSEFMWACVGAGVGLIIPVLEKIKSAFIDDPATPLTIIGTFEICIFFVSVALVVLIAKISSTRSKKADELATEIRGRGRV